MSNYFELPSEGELILAHHGILGQKWGVRRYQNSDGSLTDAGRRRYGSEENFKKIQDARADAAAYKIRAKAKIKAQKKETKELEKLNKKNQKKYEKEQLREYEKYLKKKEKLDDKYKHDKGRDAAKALVKEFVREAVWPNVKISGRKIIGSYMENALMDDDQKKLKKLEKDTEKLEKKHRYNQAKINSSYSDWMSDDTKQKSWDEIGNMSLKDLNDYNNRYNKYSNIQKIRYGSGSGSGSHSGKNNKNNKGNKGNR